jgi:hypothetical protein
MGLPRPCSVRGGGVCTEDLPPAHSEDRSPDEFPTFAGGAPPVTDPCALFFLHQILPKMRTQLRTSFGGIIGYDYGELHRLCDLLDVPVETRIIYLEYLQLFEAALLTSQRAQRGEADNGG